MDPKPDSPATAPLSGRVVKLDRGFPLVELDDGTQLRAEHDVAFSKEGADAKDDATAKGSGGVRGVVVGDRVWLRRPEGHDKAIITGIQPRERVLVRRDPAEEATEQVLAANFDWIFIADPLTDLNFRRLERELVIAHLTGASIAVVLTKADLVKPDVRAELEDRVRALADREVRLITIGEGASEAELETLRGFLASGQTAVLIGKSGVGKSSLVNRLAGAQLQRTAEVRAKDGKGRHTTVSREMIPLPSGGRVIDMPGVRGLGLWQAHEGIDSAFADIVELAASCRFRDCTHQSEPDCAVRAAVEEGRLSPLRLRSYVALKQESDSNAREAWQQSWSRRR